MDKAKEIIERNIESRPIKLAILGECDFNIFVKDPKYSPTYINSKDADIANKIITSNIESALEEVKPDAIIMFPESKPGDTVDLNIAEIDILDIGKKYYRLLMVDANYNFKRLFETYNLEKIFILKGYDKWVISLSN